MCGVCVCVVGGGSRATCVTPQKPGARYANLRMPARVAIPIGECTSSLLGALPTFDDDGVIICADTDADGEIVG